MSLRLEHVRLTYPDGDQALVALDDVSLVVEPGEFVAVTGPSGSGKSSLLAVAGGLVTPDSGRVVIAGTDVGRLPMAARDALRRDRIGYVFQQSNLLGSLTARDQLLLVGRLGGRRIGAERAALRRRADTLLDRVGLSARANRRPYELSGGERQRVGIARALMGEPAVLLVDEPTSALDHERGRAVMDLLCEMTREDGVATLVVTHDLQYLPLADRAVALHDGSIHAAERLASAPVWPVEPRADGGAANARATVPA